MPPAAPIAQVFTELRFRVPVGATTLVNVTGLTYTTTARPTYAVMFWNGSSSRLKVRNRRLPGPRVGARRVLSEYARAKRHDRRGEACAFESFS